MLNSIILTLVALFMLNGFVILWMRMVIAAEAEGDLERLKALLKTRLNPVLVSGAVITGALIVACVIKAFL